MCVQTLQNAFHKMFRHFYINLIKVTFYREFISEGICGENTRKLCAHLENCTFVHTIDAF